jgi:hypothetical protein
MMLLELLVPLVTLDAKKHHAENQGQDQEHHDLLTAPQLARAFRQHHGETAAQQHRRVDGAWGLGSFGTARGAGPGRRGAPAKNGGDTGVIGVGTGIISHFQVTP